MRKSHLDRLAKNGSVLFLATHAACGSVSEISFGGLRLPPPIERSSSLLPLSPSLRAKSARSDGTFSRSDLTGFLAKRKFGRVAENTLDIEVKSNRIVYQLRRFLSSSVAGSISTWGAKS